MEGIPKAILDRRTPSQRVTERPNPIHPKRHTTDSEGRRKPDEYDGEGGLTVWDLPSCRSIVD